MKYKPITQRTLNRILSSNKTYFGYKKSEILNLNTQINKARYSFIKFEKVVNNPLILLK